MLPALADEWGSLRESCTRPLLINRTWPFTGEQQIGIDHWREVKPEGMPGADGAGRDYWGA
jgi:hypothetical protein